MSLGTSCGYRVNAGLRRPRVNPTESLRDARVVPDVVRVLEIFEEFLALRAFRFVGIAGGCRGCGCSDQRCKGDCDQGRGQKTHVSLQRDAEQTFGARAAVALTKPSSGS